MFIPLLVATAAGHVPIVYAFGPDDNWCGFLNQTANVGGETFYPGDVVAFQPGEYGPCSFHAPQTDSETEFTILQSVDATDPARFTHAGDVEAVLDVTGQQLFLVDLQFEATPPGVDAVRLHGPSGVWVRSSTFVNTSGTGIRVLDEANDVWILDSLFQGGPGTAVWVGCPGCSGGIRLRDGLFLDVASGVRGEEGSHLEVSDSVFSNVNRAIDVVGGEESTELNGNLLVGVGEGILLGAGRSLIRNNIIMGESALQISDGSQSRVLGNSFVRGAVEAASVAEATDNAGPASLGEGNVVCGSECWRNPEGLDFYPERVLLDVALGTFDGALGEDFCGRTRENAAMGAVDWVGEEGWPAFTVDFKRTLACTAQEPPGTGFSEPPAEEGEACGCRTTGPTPAAMLLLLLAGWCSRNRALRPGDHRSPAEE